MRRFAFWENLGFCDQDLRFSWPTNMKSGLKWVHMAQYELILRLDGALWLRIISKPLLTQKWLIKIKKIIEKSQNDPNILVGVVLV